MVTHETTRTLATLSATGTTRKLATITAWNGGKPKLDLRVWRTDEKGGPDIPGKGVTLDRKELLVLLKALEDQNILNEL